jgi:hypothetical protein
MRVYRNENPYLFYTARAYHQELKRSEKLREALESIASLKAKSAAKQDQSVYWRTEVTHDGCADVLAKDTQIARAALKEYESESK